jgi:hypothetical protein
MRLSEALSEAAEPHDASAKEHTPSMRTEKKGKANLFMVTSAKIRKFHQKDLPFA